MQKFLTYCTTISVLTQIGSLLGCKMPLSQMIVLCQTNTYFSEQPSYYIQAAPIKRIKQPKFIERVSNELLYDILVWLNTPHRQCYSWSLIFFIYIAEAFIYLSIPGVYVASVRLLVLFLCEDKKSLSAKRSFINYYTIYNFSLFLTPSTLNSTR